MPMKHAIGEHVYPPDAFVGLAVGKVRGAVPQLLAAHRQNLLRRVERNTPDQQNILCHSPSPVIRCDTLVRFPVTDAPAVGSFPSERGQPFTALARWRRLTI